MKLVRKLAHWVVGGIFGSVAACLLALCAAGVVGMLGMVVWALVKAVMPSASHATPGGIAQLFLVGAFILWAGNFLTDRMQRNIEAARAREAANAEREEQEREWRMAVVERQARRAAQQVGYEEWAGAEAVGRNAGSNRTQLAARQKQAQRHSRIVDREVHDGDDASDYE